MITVHLYGKYRKTYGETFKLAVKDLRAAIRLLEANFPGKFAKQVEQDKFYVARGKELGKGKHININDVGMLELEAPEGAHFHLIPAATGGAGMRSKGLGALLLGAVLIGASFLFTGGLASTMFYAGLSMLAGGASLLLSPEVATEEGEESKSYAFNGPLNVEEQGALEPVVYGRAIVGSVVGAGSIKSVNQGSEK